MKVPAQVSVFLQIAKAAVAENGCILVNREASRAFLIERGMTVEDVIELIGTLKVSDCFDGPEPDRDPRYSDWTVAEFRPNFEGERLYLKLSVKVDANQCKCLSVKLYTERTVS